MAGHIDYSAVLRDLESKRNELDTAIRAIKRLLGAEVTHANIVGTRARFIEASEPESIPEGAFLGKSIGDSAIEYLKRTRSPRTPKQIANALEKGGFAHRSKNFTNTVRTTIVRMDEIVRIGKRWGLREWAPALRNKRVRNDAFQGKTIGIEENHDKP